MPTAPQNQHECSPNTDWINGQCS